LIERHIESLDWVTLILVSCFIVIALAKYLYPKRFEEFILLPLTNKYFLIQGKNDLIIHPFNLLLFIVQVCVASLFIFLFFENKTSGNSWLFIQILTGYTVFILIKMSIEKIISVIFSIEGIINQYIYLKLSYKNFLALLLFLANILFYYIIEPSKVVLIILATCIVFFNAISLIYSYKTYKNNILNNFFYFILYLCALEISPFIILYITLV
jgi:hypothetical protein